MLRVPKRKRDESGSEFGSQSEQHSHAVSAVTPEGAPELTSPTGQWTPPARDPDDHDSIASDLELTGVCVVKNILSEVEQTDFENSFWRAMTRRKPQLQQHDPTTWIPDNYKWRGNYGAGQYKHYGMAQEEHCWMIRKNAVIRRIFESAVFKEECCVSLDGAAALFEPCVSQLELHVDLAPNLRGFDFGSVQGAYNLFGVETDGDKCGACFVCVPGSHKLYDELWAETSSKKGFKMPKKHRIVLDKDSPLQQQTVKVITPPNSLTLWSSKLQHKNYGGDFTTAELGRICRLVMFVAWQPKSCRTEGDRLKKIKQVQDGVSGNHWAALAFREGIKPFPPWGSHSIPCVSPFQGQKTLPEDVESLL